MYSLIRKYKTVNALKSNLEKEIEEVEEIIQGYSNILGEKIRTNELSKDDPEFLELKSKLEGGSTDKKKSDDKTVDSTDPQK